MIPIGTVIHERLTGPKTAAMNTGLIAVARTGSSQRSNYDPSILTHADLFADHMSPATNRLASLIGTRAERHWGHALKRRASWINFYDEGISFGLHSHPKSVLTACYYPRGAGCFEYISSNAQFKDLPTTPGTLLFFNSETVHDVGWASTERVCIAVTYNTQELERTLS